jgi:hypothetical protein
VHGIQPEVPEGSLDNRDPITRKDADEVVTAQQRQDSDDSIMQGDLAESSATLRPEVSVLSGGHTEPNLLQAEAALAEHQATETPSVLEEPSRQSGVPQDGQPTDVAITGTVPPSSRAEEPVNMAAANASALAKDDSSEQADQPSSSPVAQHLLAEVEARKEKSYANQSPASPPTETA